MESLQYCLLSGASMPLKRMRWPWTSIVSPSMTDATPVIGSGFDPNQFETPMSGIRSVCCMDMADCVARAAMAATVTKTSRNRKLARRRALDRLVPLHFRH
ncbi:hypothetical protein [Mesorhizobium caraganae]|uniref:hypothetical protein n=1 Tax=Mesorhizobium caraganae TaxID=483206 RepID=UPI00178731F1|nr:hypothetical protein [Mesorhizobium caraganae]